MKMRRRSFLTLLGGAAVAWPRAARAQQPAMPVIGYIHLSSPELGAKDLGAFRRGLSETGFVEGRNVGIEYHFAEDDFNRLPALAANLVDRRVAVIVGSHTSPALAAKSATTDIPIVFVAGTDPVQAGLVASFNRPGGNITGMSSMSNELGAKRLGLLHELLPRSKRIAVIANPSAALLELQLAEMQAAAAALGKELEILRAGTNRQLDAAFGNLVKSGAEAFVIAPSPFFVNRRVQLITLAAHHRVPAIYQDRQIAEAGGLMSYSPATMELHRQAGIYAGRILKGEKPADLPVMQPTKFEFVINLQTARTLGIEVPPTLLALADEVIE
jgi:putative ABC transport system substrate-binding protein